MRCKSICAIKGNVELNPLDIILLLTASYVRSWTRFEWPPTGVFAMSPTPFRGKH